MIVVIGSVSYLETEAGPEAGGLAARVARTVADHGHAVQLVGKVGEDDAGDAVMLALARHGIGHVAMLREAGRPTPQVEVQADESTASDEMTTAGNDAAPSAETADDPRLETADVDLALRYLTEFAVLVLADQVDDAMSRVVASAADWSDARLVAVVPAGEVEPTGLPPDAIVFEAPTADPDGVFASMVGSFAAALDDGDEPGAAFRAAVASEGWTALADEADRPMQA
jgi:hypothetical protein